MNTNLYELTEAQSQGACTRPDMSGRLYDYIDDPVEYPAAKEVENHLFDCLTCREFFLTVLDARNEAYRSENKRGEDDGGAPKDLKVLRLADFRKRRP